MSTRTDKASFTLIEPFDWLRTRLPVVRPFDRSTELATGRLRPGKRKSYAFTLIELLVVITIIGILIGMIFKMMGMTTRKSDKADCISRLEKISHALEEYRAEYGQYPPVTRVAYEYANTNNQTEWLREVYAWDGAGEILFDYGLVAYLWLRDQDTISDRLKGLASGDNNPGVNWIGDVPRDENAKARWNPFINDILEDDTQARTAFGGSPYSNDTLTVEDSWGNEIHYECPAPFLSYRLWSSGPDGTDGTSDDIHREKWDN